jgi:hypothetical protein
VSRKFDGLVAPFRRSILAGDETGSVDTPEITVHESVPCLDLLGGSLRQAQEPFGVLIPRMRPEVSILVFGLRLPLTPIAVEHVLAGINEFPSVGDCALVHRVLGHGISMQSDPGSWRSSQRFNERHRDAA